MQSKIKIHENKLFFSFDSIHSKSQYNKLKNLGPLTHIHILYVWGYEGT